MLQIIKYKESMPSIQCENCGLLFDKENDLRNHKAKFCINSKYGDIESIDKNFGNASKNRDISLYGKMSLAMQGKGFDFDNGEITQNKNLDQEYRKILKEIEEEKNVKNRLENQREKAFRELEALEKQEEELVVDDKRKNLQDVIFRREQLRREEEQLQRELRDYEKKKVQWDKSQVKVLEKRDQPFEQGVKIGKIQQQRQILQQKKHNLELELNGKKRQKEKLEKELLQMSAVDELNLSRISNQSKKSAKSNVVLKSSYVEPEREMYDSRRNNFYKGAQSKASSISSNLAPGVFRGTEKVYKFNLNKQGKSQEDLLLEELRAQEYDDLQILSKLPKDSQLYKKKLNQYQELSEKRMDIYQKAQRQRLEKMKRQFEYDKQINTRERQNSQWVDQNRKALMNEQINLMKNYGQGKPEDEDQYYSQPSDQYVSSLQQMPSSQGPPKNQQRPSIADRVGTGSRPPNGIPPPSSFTKNKNPNQGSMISRPNLGSMALSGNKNGLISYPYGSPPKQQQPAQDTFGYRISVLFLKNYSHKKAIKVKLTIYEQFYRKQELGMKYQFSTVYHDETLDPNQPYNPAFKNKLNSKGQIAYHESFYVPQNLQNLYNNNQKQIYLMIVAAEKDEKRVTNQPKPYGWYNFKITHFGQLKEGRFTFNLYADDMIFPFPADMNRMRKKKQEQITIEVEEVILDQEMLRMAQMPNSDKNISNNTIPNQNTAPNGRLEPSIANMTSSANLPTSDKNSLNGSKHNMNYPLVMKNVEDENTKNINEYYFYTNEKSSEFSHCSLKKPLNFDVSVAALRTLPSYIGPVKLQLSFIDADGAHVLPREQFLAEISTDLYNPLVNYTRQIRNEAKIPPSTIIFIRMIALSALDYNVYSLGFSLIYLFLDKEGEAIRSNKIVDYFMTSGYYQLPIFWGNIEPKYIPIEELLSQYSPIPCSSILIGILENASKISNPMPQYREKVYNTILFRVDENEAKLFEQQYKRQPIDTNTLMSGYLQYKGIKKNYSGEQIRKYLFRSLSFGPQSMKFQLQLKWMAEYQEYFGISFVVDKLIIPKTEQVYYYFITICLSPPANYYKSKGFDLNLIRNIDFKKSKLDQLLYLDNQIFFNPSYDRNTCLIIEVNRIQIFQSQSTQADTNIEGFAYTVIPLFQIHEKIRAPNVLREKMVLYKGDFDVNNLGKIQKSLPGFVDSLGKTKKSQSQLHLRILNGFYMNQFQPFKQTSKSPPYKELQPENMDFGSALQEIASTLSNNYNLQIS